MRERDYWCIDADELADRIRSLRVREGWCEEQGSEDGRCVVRMIGGGKAVILRLELGASEVKSPLSWSADFRPPDRVVPQTYGTFSSATSILLASASRQA